MPVLMSWDMHRLGCLPLEYAAQLGKLKTVRLLLQLGADINARHKNGYTALHRSIACAPRIIHIVTSGLRAAIWGHDSIISLLLDMGANATLKTTEQGRREPATAEDLARAHGHAHAVQLLNHRRQSGKRKV